MLNTITAADLTSFLAETEAGAEQDYLVNPEVAVERMFAAGPRTIVSPTLGPNVEFAPGELTIWGGAAGSGKSLLTGQVAQWAALDGERFVIASLEMPIGETARRMVRQAFNGTVSRETATAWAERMEGHLWFYDQIDTVASDRLLNMARYASDRLGCSHVIIDSLTKAGLPVDGDGWLSAQTRFIDQLQHVAKHTGLSIHIVAHMRKGNGGRADLHDVRGASQITDLADRVVLLHRNKDKERLLQERDRLTDEKLKEILVYPDAVLQVEKQRSTGWVGDIGLRFHAQSTQFLPGKSVHPLPWESAAF